MVKPAQKEYRTENLKNIKKIRKKVLTKGKWCSIMCKLLREKQKKHKIFRSKTSNILKRNEKSA